MCIDTELTVLKGVYFLYPNANGDTPFFLAFLCKMHILHENIINLILFSLWKDFSYFGLIAT